MKVAIDGVEYVPASMLGKDANETALAILRAIVSGYYSSIHCNVDGEAPKAHCDCSGCQLNRVVMQFLGKEPECKEESEVGFCALWDAARR